jgi:hypothetical protein
MRHAARRGAVRDPGRPAGGLPLPVLVPDVPARCGLSVFFRGLEADPAAPQGVSFTRGLELAIGI